MRPLVSILVNNYNYGRFLHEAIDSALNQTYTNTEVVVVDDGSTDNSREIIAGYGDRIVSVFKKNGGQASTFNSGFGASHGEWILFLDSDDLFAPRKAEEAMRLATENPDVGVIAHNLEYVGTDGSPISFCRPPILQHRLVDDRKRIRRGRLTARLPATSGLCLRRGVLGQILPMPEEFVTAADNYVKLAALTLTPILQVPQALGRQRIHGQNYYTSAMMHNGADTCRRALITARIGFHAKERYPALKKLIWKQYGRILYELTRVGTEEARAVKADIKSRYSVVEPSATCLLYVGGAFTRALVRDVFRTQSDA